MRQAGTASRIDTAMVMAAGLGKRMRPITDRIPKPLVEIGGRTMLDHALDRLKQAGIGRAVVNVHYLADQIEAHLAGYDGLDITISDERDELLETGGGARRALPLLGREFLVMNSDSLWVEGEGANLPRMLAEWDPASMDILLLLAPVERTLGYDGKGDFAMDGAGRLARRSGPAAPFVYAGVGVFKASLFDAANGPLPEGPFSLNLLFDRAIASGRLFGSVLDGEWLHVGTPDAIAPAEARMRAGIQARAAAPLSAA
jgi:MurNAc alpha-1-phosphate uridylyltransferase